MFGLLDWIAFTIVGQNTPLHRWAYRRVTAWIDGDLPVGLW